MTKATTWLLVADAERARIFAVAADGATLEREPLHELTAEMAPSREIASDRPGRTFDSAGEGRHAKAPPTDPKRHEKERFARAVVELLESARGRSEFDHLAVVAPPPMLGDLRTLLSPQLRAMVVAETAKDLAMRPAHDLETQLAELLVR